MGIIILLLALFGTICLFGVMYTLINTMNCINIKCRRKGCFDKDTPYCSKCVIKNIED